MHARRSMTEMIDCIECLDSACQSSMTMYARSDSPTSNALEIVSSRTKTKQNGGNGCINHFFFYLTVPLVVPLATTLPCF